MRQRMLGGFILQWWGQKCLAVKVTFEKNLKRV